MCYEAEDNDGCEVGSFEQGCIDYALFGDPRRDHDDYEFNAAYDRFDGYRESNDYIDYNDGDVCGGVGDQEGCDDYADGDVCDIFEDDDDFTGCADDDDAPF